MNTTIKLDGKDIYSTYGLTITRIEGRGLPPASGESLNLAYRDGVLNYAQRFEPRTIRLEGHIEGSSHSDLMTKFNSLKAVLNLGYLGLRLNRLAFQDMSTEIYVVKLKEGMTFNPLAAWFVVTSAEISMTFECLNGFALGAWQRVERSIVVNQRDWIWIDSIGSGTVKPIIRFKRTDAGDSLAGLEIAQLGVWNRLKTISAVESSFAGTKVDGSFGSAVRIPASSAGTVKYAVLNNLAPRRMTIRFRFKKNFTLSDGNQHTFFEGSTDSTIACYYDGVANKIKLANNGTVRGELSGSLIDDSDWHTITCVFGESSVYLYLDDGTNSNGASDSDVTKFTYIFVGTDNDGANSADSDIDEFMIIGEELSTAEISDWHTLSGSSSKPPFLPRKTLLYLDFEDTLDGIAHNHLKITGTSLSFEENDIIVVDCIDQEIYKVDDAAIWTKESMVANFTGDIFDFSLEPGVNSFEFVATSIATSLDVDIFYLPRY